MDAKFLKYAEQSAPRYTSYPTAPHFNASVDGDVYRGWLSELPIEASLSLYLHTPYCRQMCWYCGCHAFAVQRDGPVAQFVEAIQAEIDAVAAATSARRVTEIHWGGGTPNALNPEQFGAIAVRLAQRFDLTACERHAVEIDPRILTPEHVATMARIGVNRASLGVQDFDENVQRAIGRVQPFEQVRDAVAMVRNGGIEALSFDLMYGLPHQTLESVRRTAELALSLNPHRFSVFGYAHVPWFKTRQRLIDSAALPGAGVRHALAEAIRETLSAAGYVEIGYDHYARPDDPIAVAAQVGALERNFQGFVETSCDALVGLGPSAISTLPQGYAQNEAEVGAWRAGVMNGGFAIKRGRGLSEDDRQRRDLIMRLLCDFRLDLGERGGFAAFPETLCDLRALAADGLVELSDDRIIIPQAGRAFARLVAQTFDAYRNTGAARHSQAV
ncbi:MAG: oxygen-independent coproporphyrinogen III oxidase [Hyphomonadaceae bacterium JAD_PAG50586_4]|nr:MAG: oxygen-independent coproporphyrinogen III oxidase [Hyphomonadaceae bacterium JAD_PAG50586_4]